MNYLLRTPKFPVIVDTGHQLIAARTKAQFEKRIRNISFNGKDTVPIIDRTAEAFALYPEKEFVAPQVAIRRWTKASIIDLYNERRPTNAPEMEQRSLGNRSLEQIVSETVDLLA
jgi:hypothetical protein